MYPRRRVEALYGPGVRVNPLTYGNAMMLCNWTFLNFPDAGQVRVRAFNGTILSSGVNGSCRRTDQGMF